MDSLDDAIRISELNIDLDELAADLHGGKITKEDYDKKSYELEAELKILYSKEYDVKKGAASFNLHSQADMTPLYERKKHFQWHSYAIVLILVLASAWIFIYLNSSCIRVNFSANMFELFDILDYLEKASPKDLDMICKYSDSISTKQGTVSQAYTGKIIITNNLIEHYPQRMVSSILVHEGCHNLMHRLYGGYQGLNEAEVERPCERMRYMYLLRAGEYSSYHQMIEALTRERYGREELYHSSSIPAVFMKYKGDTLYQGDSSPLPYCQKTKLTVEPITFNGVTNLAFRNDGSTIIHCGLIDFRVNGTEYPLDCHELKPGASHLTGKHFRLGENDKYTSELVGCDRLMGKKSS